MANTYRKIEGATAKSYITRLNAGWAGSPFDNVRTALHARDLNFLKGWRLVEASDATSLPEKKCVALDNGKEAIPLEYNEHFIFNFCQARNMRIDQEAAADYLRFWLEYLRIGAERFRLVESFDEICWREDPSPQARKYLNGTITPLTLKESSAERFVYKGFVLFLDALFECSFEITNSGKIAILSRNTLVEDLDITDSFTGF